MQIQVLLHFKIRKLVLMFMKIKGKKIRRKAEVISWNGHSQTSFLPSLTLSFLSFFLFCQTLVESPWLICRVNLIFSEKNVACNGSPTKTYLTAQGTLLNVMWQPGWEGNLGRMGTCICISQSSVSEVVIWEKLALGPWPAPLFQPN